MKNPPAHAVNRLELLARSKYLFLIFFATSAVVFSSFFLRGQVLLATTDNLFTHYPNLIYGLRALRHGDFGLWNPYIFAGVDFTTSMHHHMLHPVNWILALFPEKYIFHVLTIEAFLEVSFIGYLAFRIFELYQSELWAALLLAIVAQLGGFTWFTITTFIGLHLFFISLVAIYIIVTHESRRKIVTFVLLSLCFFDILMMGHVGYIFAFGLPVIVAFAVKTWPDCLQRPWTGLTPTFVAAGLIGAVMASPRLWAVLHGLLYEQLVVPDMWLPSLPGNTGYFVLTGFIPEALGIHLGDAAGISQMLNIGGRHTQFHNLLYFGTVPVIFVYLSLLGTFGSRALALSLLFLFVAFTQIFVIQPVSDVFNVLLFPAIHDIIPRVWAAFLILATLVFTLRELISNRAKPKEPALRGFVLVIGLVVAMAITMGVKVLHEQMAAVGPENWPGVFVGLRLALFAVLAVSVGIVWKLRFDVDTTRKLSNVAAIVFLIAALVGTAVAFKLRLFSEQWLVLRGFVYTLGAAIWCLTMLALVRSSDHGESNKARMYYRMAIAGIAVAVAMMLIPIPEMSGQRTVGGNALAATMGAFKFILLAFIAIELMARWIGDRVSRKLFLVLITLFTVGDLLFFTKIYSHVGASPFISAQSIYPPRVVPGRKAEFSAWRESDAQLDLLVNPQMSSANGVVQGWVLGGSKTRFAHAAAGSSDNRSVTIVAEGDDGGTLFQDVTNIGKPEAISFGAWVRATGSKKAALLITNRENGRQSVFHTGSGKWEWLTVTIENRSGIEIVRPHVAIIGRGEVALFGPRMVRGLAVRPAGRPDGDINPTKELQIAEHGPQLIDLSQYRVNNPNNFAGRYYGEFSNIPMVYELPSYGGVDSDVKRDLVEFISAFEPGNPNWIARIGIVPHGTNQRMLDLFGVKYDFTQNGDILVRPNALARLSLFSNYEVLTDPKQTLQRLKEEAFDPVTTVVIERDPHWDAGIVRMSQRFQPVAYRSSNTSRLDAEINLARPAILLFNDSYSPFWRAFFDGKELPVVRANGNFMAVNLPSGHGMMTLEFVPKPFLTFVRMSAGTAVILVLVALYAIVTGVRRDRKTLA